MGEVLRPRGEPFATGRCRIRFGSAAPRVDHNAEVLMAKKSSGVELDS
jgi:hypothetical protein